MSNNHASPAILIGQPTGALALTLTQAAIWSVQQQDPTNPAFITGTLVDIRGPLDIIAFTAAAQRVVRATAALSLRFADKDALPVQWVDPALAAKWQMPVDDLMATPDPEVAAHAAIQALLSRSMDLLAGTPLFRWHLFRVAPDRALWLNSLHHILADGLGRNRLAHDVAAAYAAGTRREEADPGGFRTVLETSSPRPGSRAWARSQTYWRQHLAGIGVAATPAIPPGKVPVMRVARQVPPATRAALAAQARRLGVTLPELVATAAAIFANNPMGSRDFLLGWVVANRRGALAAATPSPLSNLTPLRLAPLAAESLDALAKQVARAARGALRHQGIPWHRLRRELNLLPGEADPLAMSVNFLPDAGPLTFGSATARCHILANGPLRPAIIFQDDLREGPTLYLEDLADPQDVALQADQLLALLEAIALAPATAKPSSLLPVTAASPPGTLPELFAAQAVRTPEAAALICGETYLSYAELDARANCLARLLAAEGIGAEDVVALALPRSVDMVVALLAVVKAGAAWLALDPDYPPRRLGFMLADSRAARIIGTTASLTALLAANADLSSVISLDDPSLRARLAAMSSAPLTQSERARPLRPENLAYLIYTSGSTGTPKASANTQASVVNLAWRPSYAPIGPDDVVLQFAPFTFDAAVFEIWGALLNGAQLVLAPHGPVALPELAALCARHGVTIAWMTAGLFERAAADHLPIFTGLRQLLAGGDVLSMPVLRRVRGAFPSLRIVNGYGPTETTTFACTHELKDPDLAAPTLPIGKPIDNVAAYVLDTALRPVPPGVIGELFLAGAGLARGYAGRPGLTAERFLADPFGPPGTRMYRTGDLARWRGDGSLDFLGRVDAQIKLRGFRIEPGEIEAALLEQPGILQASVLLREMAGEPRLVAYLVPRPGAVVPAPETLRAALADRLPEHMVPRAFVTIETLPLTPNGKLDRHALPMPKALAGLAYRAPRSAHEDLLCRLFAELTGAERVGIDDGFFALGGSSLSAMRLLARLRVETGKAPPLRTLFQQPTPMALAAAMTDASASSDHFDPLMPFISLRRERPFFCVPGLGAGAMHLRHLGEALGRSRPVFGLNGLPEQSSSETIEGIAEFYVRAIRKAHAEGPYFLGGYSLGGIVAYEMARQFDLAGLEVGLLAVLDGRWPAWRVSPRTLLPTTAAWLRNLPVWLLDEGQNFDARAMRRRLRRKARLWWATLRKDELRPGMILDLERIPNSDHGLLDRQLSAVRGYAPQSARLPIAVFRAAVQPVSNPCGDPAFGWRAAADDTFISYTVPGNHLTMLAQPHVEDLARAINAELRRRQ